MSAEPDFRCPVCRARQPLRDTCRRCQADLRLVARARHRVEYLKRQRDLSRARGDRARERAIAAELDWLAPGC